MATRTLLDLLGASNECQLLKQTNQLKKMGEVYARFADMFNRAGPSTPFTGTKVAAKVKNLNSAWRSVDETISKLRNRGASKKAVEEKKGKHYAPQIWCRLMIACVVLGISSYFCSLIG